MNNLIDDQGNPTEFAKIEIQLWQESVETQRHFNDIKIKLRSILISVQGGLLGVAGFALKTPSRFELVGIETNSSALIVFIGGFTVLIAFFIAERGYHLLLLGAVRNGASIEERLLPAFPGIGLGKSISKSSSSDSKFQGSKFSPKWLYCFFFKNSSSRLRGFYALLGILILASSFFLSLVRPAERNDKHPTLILQNHPSNLPDLHTEDCGTAALKKYKENKYNLEVKQTTSLIRERILERGTIPKNAIAIIDIDDTALSTWGILDAGNFCWDSERFAKHVEEGKLPAIPETLELYNWVQSLEIEVIFITARSEIHRKATKSNLTEVGFLDYRELIMKPEGSTVSSAEYKRSKIQKIRSEGFEIIFKLGDQLSDIEYPVGVNDYLMPNPFYTTHEKDDN